MDNAAARTEANAEEDANRRTPTWARLEQQIAWYDRAAQRSQFWHRALKVVQLVLGAAVPVAAATGSARWLLGALGALVVVIEGVQQLFQFHRNCSSKLETPATELHPDVKLGPRCSVADARSCASRKRRWPSAIS